MNPSRLYRNATFHSLEKEGEVFSAMRVDARGRIAELYPAGAPLPSEPEAVDLGGRTVVPGFIDAHTHFMSKAGLAALAVSLSSLEGGRIVPDCLDGVRALLQAKAEEGQGPVMGFGLCLGVVAERRLPKDRELDAWLPGRPVIVLSLDGHSSSYSSPALAALGFASLAEEGILRGEAHEFNLGRVTSYLMKGLGPAALARGLSETLKEAAKAGLVSIHCLEGTEGQRTDLAVRVMALLGGRLGPRLRLWLQYTDPAEVARYAKYLDHPRVGGCLAWEMDGSVSSRTAAFDRNYLDRADPGSLYRTGAEALALVEPFFKAGYQTSAHAIGPRGIESILSAYEGLLDGAGDPANARRLRIDHFEFPRPDQVERAGRRRLVLPVQPGFAWLDERYVHSYGEALAPEILARQCPLRSLAQAGCVLALSTDAPVQPFNPFVQVAGAVDHPVPAESLSVHEALRAYSWAGAYSAFEEGERGTLAVGKHADFALLDSDPFTCPKDKLCDINILGTWHEGRPLEAPPPGLSGFAARLATTKKRRL